MYKAVKVTTDNCVEVVDLKKWNSKGWEDTLQAECTEMVYTLRMHEIFGDEFGGRMCFLVDESGVNNGKDANPIASYLYGGGTIHGDILFGLMVSGDFEPLKNPEELKKMLQKKFPCLN